MERWYKKNKGNAGLVGAQFQVSLLTVCLLNALKHRKDWTISTENPEAGKYDDIVVELPGTTAVLIQAKHKENRKITKDQLLSVNTKNADFSLAKYFFSYEQIKKKFKKKVVIICTDTSLNNKGLEDVLTANNADVGSMLHCGDEGCSFYTFNEEIVPDLKMSATEYLNKNLQGRGIDKKVITDENIKDFLSNLQIFTNYPSESEMHDIIGLLLSGLHESSLWRRTSSQEVYKKVEDWFVQPKGEYLTEFRAKALFCEIKSDRYVEALKDFRVSFDRNDFEFAGSKRIFHVTAEGVHLLQVLKIYHTLQDNNNKLYANPEDDMEVHRHVIEAFGLRRYVYLIMVWSKVTQGTLIKEMGDKLRHILEESPYKKVILVAEGRSVLPQQVGLQDVSQVDGSVTFKDLSTDSQQKLLKFKNIDFQGKLVSLEELLEGQTMEDYATSLGTDILDELVKGTRVTVGVRLLDLNEDVARYYISRMFKRDDRGYQRRVVTEESIFNVEEKVVLIADGAGTGKTTVLSKLAVALKERRPHQWIVRVNLNEYTRVLKNYHSHKKINIIELLDSEEGTKLTTPFEKFIFSLKNKVIIILDGVDEISPNYTSLILDLIVQCQKAPNFAKILVTTRPHMTPQLEETLNVDSYRLIPLTIVDQIDFLSRYWTHNLQLQDNNIMLKCKQYAGTLMSEISSWVTGLYFDSEFPAIPLLLRVLAEMFQENVRAHIEGNSMPLNLPEKFIAKLYDTFLENKRDIFIEKGNPSGNARANEALSDQFEECLACHRSLALKVTLNATESNLFSSLRDNKAITKHVLVMGVVEKLREEFQFKHKTFAEYFLADGILKELQLPNTIVQFQQFLIEDILQKPIYKVVRIFLNNLLEKTGDSLAPNVFESYHSTSNAWASKENLVVTLSNEGCVAVLRLILSRISFQTINETDIEAYRRSKDVNFRNADGDLPLHVAIKKDDMELAKYLIELGADLLARDCTDRGPLHLAAERCQMDTIKLLLQHGADVNNRDMGGRTAMHLATLNESWEAAEYLLECGGDINIIGNDGRTALHVIAEKGRLNTMIRFLEHGVDVNVRDRRDCTPLHAAANSLQLEIVKLLIRYKADVNIQGNDGQTALHVAASHCNEVITKYLVNHGANVNIRNKYGSTALSLASKKGNFPILKSILDSGANINERTNDGHTALHTAVMEDRSDLVEDIVAHDGDITISDFEGRTALHLALHNTYGDPKIGIVKYFVNVGLDVNVADNSGRTPLHAAARNGEVDVIEYLVINGLNIHVIDNNGWTALHFAADSGSREAVRYFVQHGIGVNVTDKKGCTAFHLAARGSCDETVKFLVTHGADVKLRTCDGRSALHYAAQGFYTDTVAYLLECGLDVNIRNGDGRTALHMAAERDKEEFVKYLVEQGAQVNYIDSGGHTALRLAVENNMEDAVRSLVEKGADTNIRSADGRTALHVAVDKENVSIIKYLARHGADANLRDNDSLGALHFVAQNNITDVIRCLVYNGADLNLRSADGRTPLHLAVEVAGNYTHTVEVLADFEVGINATDNDGNTALHLVARRDVSKDAKYLLEHGANVNLKNSVGHTALHLAVGHDCREIIKHLVKHSADINDRDSEGRTALHVAAELGFSHTIRYLMKCGADGNIRDSDGRTAMHWAAQFGCLNSIECLVEYGANINMTDSNNCTALHFAASNFWAETVKLFLKLGADVNAADSYGRTALHLSVSHGVSTTFGLLVEAGADVKVRDTLGRTVLHIAAALGLSHTVRYLMKCDADGNVKDNSGRTAMHSAAQFGCLDSIKCLVEHGVDINMADSNNNTALHLAVINRQTETVELLLKLGADIDAADSDGCTTLHIAAQYGTTAIFELLLKKGADVSLTNNEGYTALHIGVKSGVGVMERRDVGRPKVRAVAATHGIWPWKRNT